MAVRLYLVFFTEGSFDVQLWESHARHILELGLSGYYASDVASVTVFNHPPLIGKVVSSLYWLSNQFGVPFKIPFRLLLTSLDYVAAYHLLKLFPGHKQQRLMVSFYLLNPLTVIFSAYYGNTDTCVALAVLMSLYFISRSNFPVAGVALGLGVCVHWSALLALPAFFFALPELRQKAKLVAAVVVTALAGYAWHLCREPATLAHRVFGYKGELVQAHYDQLAVVLLVALYCWLRRNRTEAAATGRTIAEVLIIFYAVSRFSALQYLVWVTPFLSFLTLPLMLTVTVICSAYIYALYSLLCDSFLLLGKWDLIRHPLLSEPVLLLRDLSVISLLTMALFLIGDAFVQERRLRSDRQMGTQLHSHIGNCVREEGGDAA